MVFHLAGIMKSCSIKRKLNLKRVKKIKGKGKKNSIKSKSILFSSILYIFKDISLIA